MTNHLPVKVNQLPPLPSDLVERIEEYSEQAKGALSGNTERAYRADTAVFCTWCAEQGCKPLPAAPETVAAFVDAMSGTRKPATVRRYIAAIAKLHAAAGLESPARAEIVKLAVKRMNRSVGTRQDQASPLNRETVDKMIAATEALLPQSGDDRRRLIHLRDVALLSVAYDTLVRRSELIAIGIEDIAYSEDGNGTVLIRKSKTDQEGAGDIRFLAADTMNAIRRWTQAAEIESGALFRSVSKGGEIGDRIDNHDVSRIFKKMANRADVDPSGISGHSTRVGASQDMAAVGLGVTEIMQSGGWKSPVMVGRYTERLLARRGAAAKLAVLQGRANLTNGVEPSQNPHTPRKR